MAAPNFADGISEELLNLLAQVPELRVIARTSSFSASLYGARAPTWRSSPMIRSALRKPLPEFWLREPRLREHLLHRLADAVIGIQ
jgi:hypothetical protein